MKCPTREEIDRIFSDISDTRTSASNTIKAFEDVVEIPKRYPRIRLPLSGVEANVADLLHYSSFINDIGHQLGADFDGDVLTYLSRGLRQNAFDILYDPREAQQSALTTQDARDIAADLNGDDSFDRYKIKTYQHFKYSDMLANDIFGNYSEEIRANAREVADNLKRDIPKEKK